jgi:hypothetical protein
MIGLWAQPSPLLLRPLSDSLFHDYLSIVTVNFSSLQPLPVFPERPFGVNLIGHAFEVFGVGEDIRMAVRALQSAAVPCCVIYHPAGNGAACIDRSLEPLLCTDPAGGPYAFNLVCMTAPMQLEWMRKNGLAPLRGRYNIAAWPWETQQWPKAWLSLLEMTDELWPSSTFTASGLRLPAAAAGVPLHVMPMAAEVSEPERFCSRTSRISTRFRYRLPAHAVVFGYSFDFNSSVARKNPLGVLEAFQRAFPLPDLDFSCTREGSTEPFVARVALLIKTFPPINDSPEWRWLQQRAADDPRIHLVVANLDREDVLALYGCCDVFISLHRSEGFGRGMAEALQLGLDVIFTAYGGNVDFCTGPLSHPVRYDEVSIPKGAYPYSDGHLWGEPDLQHAADIMQQVVFHRLIFSADDSAPTLQSACDKAVLEAYRLQHSFEAAGVRYRARLDQLWAQRYTLSPRLTSRMAASFFWGSLTVRITKRLKHKFRSMYS